MGCPLQFILLFHNPHDQSGQFPSSNSKYLIILGHLFLIEQGYASPIDSGNCRFPKLDLLRWECRRWNAIINIRKEKGRILIGKWPSEIIARRTDKVAQNSIHSIHSYFTVRPKAIVDGHLGNNEFIQYNIPFSIFHYSHIPPTN